MLRSIQTRQAVGAFSRLTASRGRAIGNKASMMPKSQTPVPNSLHGGNFPQFAKTGGILLGIGAAQYYFGHADDIFEHKFITSKNPEDLADFYGTEDFMEVFCVLPFMVHFMMRGAEFDDNGTIHAWGLLGPGELEVSVDFDEKKIDLNGDGEPDTIAWFNKKEHFHDVAPSFLGGFTLWEMTQNFGYHRLDDGTCEVYHHGEKFNGFFPIRFIFQAHSRYVIWATEKYVNSDSFGTEDHEDEAEEFRQNVPLQVFGQFLENLTKEVEKVIEDESSSADSKKKAELEVTLQRLKTISSGDQQSIMPRLRTLRSHKTNVSHIHLVVDDKEIQNTIRKAMQQIGSSKGQRHEPVSEMYELTRRATIANRKSEGKRKQEGE